MSNVRLDAADSTELLFVRLTFKHTSERGNFDWVADWRRRPVRFDIRNRFSRNASHGLGHRDRGRLTVNARRGKTRLVAAVIVDSVPFDDAVDAISVGNCILESFHDHQACSVAEHCASCVGIERPTVAVGRKDAAALVQVSAILWESDRDTAGNRHIAVSNGQRPTSIDQCDQRC